MKIEMGNSDQNYPFIFLYTIFKFCIELYTLIKLCTCRDVVVYHEKVESFFAFFAVHC